MMELSIPIITLLIAFFSTLILTKKWIEVAGKAGLVGKDMNKYTATKIPEAGGIAVILGFVFAVLIYIFFKTFYIGTEVHLIESLALLSAIILSGLLGFVDDIIGWKVGLRQWQKPLLTIPIAIPLMVINAGHSVMNIPLMGEVDLGIIYPLLIIPIGIIGAANGFNMIAGFNGLEAGMGIIILSFLGIASVITGNLWLTLIAFSMVAALFGFLIFNKYPAKVFPGDSLTYGVGSLIAMVTILGNMERTGLILFGPYFIELILKSRSKFKAESFGLPLADGTLKPKYDKNYSLTHAIMRLGRFNEWQVVLIHYIIAILFGIVAISLLM
ncbi:MAG: glycosyl transferase family 4 [Candidatus Aenigmatarchaeota archaeon]|nr:MAG: glycosyl transferase family 4 [Candidatus Aenigmarchaeota archaeon]